MLTENKDKCASPNAKLIFDEACLDIYNEGSNVVNITGQYNECDGCKFQMLASLKPHSNASIVINTKYSLTINYTNIDTNSTCQ